MRHLACGNSTEVKSSTSGCRTVAGKRTYPQVNTNASANRWKQSRTHLSVFQLPEHLSKRNRGTADHTLRPIQQMPVSALCVGLETTLDGRVPLFLW
jgi:hypothetical protein